MRPSPSSQTRPPPRPAGHPGQCCARVGSVGVGGVGVGAGGVGVGGCGSVGV